MANDFKLKTKTGSSTPANTSMTVYSAVNTSVIIGLSLSNLTSETIAVTVSINNSDGDNITFLKSIPIPTGSAVEVMSGNKMVLEAGDALSVKSNISNSVDVALSIMEQT
jgi:hypothetical protein